MSDEAAVRDYLAEPDDGLADAIIEDTCHCDLCGGSFVLGSGSDYVIVDLPAGPNGAARGLFGSKLGVQLVLCIECAGLVVKAYKEAL
jgi:hypothetical protein